MLGADPSRTAASLTSHGGIVAQTVTGRVSETFFRAETIARLSVPVASRRSVSTGARFDHCPASQICGWALALPGISAI